MELFTWSQRPEISQRSSAPGSINYPQLQWLSPKQRNKSLLEMAAAEHSHNSTFWEGQAMNKPIQRLQSRLCMKQISFMTANHPR